MTVVILSAFVPTLIAQQLFRPVIVDTEKEEALGAEDVSVLSRAGAAQGAAERAPIRYRTPCEAGHRARAVEPPAARPAATARPG